MQGKNGISYEKRDMKIDNTTESLQALYQTQTTSNVPQRAHLL